ncbi:uncharacterized protein LOC119587683 [Penaeus monodon]|uniref:uncharacterized protein LOC119587683 n=1 Tax=Penaeus monodon TaxID=6687 RepID=UPI0018A78C65|nr:uncharacterized protein LOC119587683 [Penaeus monodon]
MPKLSACIKLASSDSEAQAAAAGPPGMKEHETMNCLVAKRLCDENSNCSAILKVIPMLCGPELVACSTVTVSRCQAALRTLALFPWFQPTCLCREPSLDAQCNIFRDLVFDHPCVFVNRKVDMHPLHYIPTCELAAEICRDNPWCKQRLDMFKTTCKFRDGQCRNPHSNLINVELRQKTRCNVIDETDISGHYRIKIATGLCLNLGTEHEHF